MTLGATLPTVLLVDDDPSIIQATSRVLGDLCACRFARDAENALMQLRSSPFALVLLDAELPGLSGLQMLAAMRADAELASVPVIMLTSHRDEYIEEAAFEHGAADFISKPIRSGVLRARVRTQLELRRVTERLVELSRTDALTGLRNRRAFEAHLELEFRKHQRIGDALSVLMVDIDHFKAFNDHYGHPEGDAAICHVARVLSTSANRPGDLAARWGGEEFALVLPATDADGAISVAETIHRRLRESPVPHARHPEGRLTVSIGLASARRGDGEGSSAASWQDVVRLADEALYTAKDDGRNRTRVSGGA